MNFIELHSGSPESFLNFLIFPLLLLLSSLLISQDKVGRVDRRFFCIVSAFETRSQNLSITTSLFINCVLSDCETSIISLSLFILFFNLVKISSFSYSLKAEVKRRLNRNSTLVLTLFTFWPPGPLLLEVEKMNSPSKNRLFNSSLCMIY